MTRRKLLKCCVCGVPTFPPTGWCEHDARRRAWEDGASTTCSECGAVLRIYVAPDYQEDQVARVVTDERYAEMNGGAR